MNEVYDIFLNTKEQPDFENYFLPGEETLIQLLPNFNTINIFVGANNSGKSWFMRSLMKQAELSGIVNYNYLSSIIKHLNELIKSLDIAWVQNPYKDRYYPKRAPEVVHNTVSLSALRSDEPKPPVGAMCRPVLRLLRDSRAISIKE